MMAMLDFEELLQRARWGGTVLAEGRQPLTEAEVEAVAEELRKPEPQADPEILILTLGRAGALRYRELVEGFLAYPEDPMVARAALEVLCDDWSMSAGYLDVVATFIEGVAWDDEGDVRLLALSRAGEHLRERPPGERLREQGERGLLELLLRVFRDPEDDPIDRGSAYFALARALGRDHDELPSAARRLNLETEIDPQVLEEAERWLGGEAKQAHEPSAARGQSPTPAPGEDRGAPPRPLAELLAGGGGPLTQAESAVVAEGLRKPEPQADREALILALGRADDPRRYEHLVMSFVGSEDPRLVRAMLKVLCEEWGMAEESPGLFVGFIHAQPWDEQGQVRLLALRLAGEYLREGSDRDLLELLLGVFRDPEEERSAREAAYRALARAVGRDHDELPSAAREIDLEAEVDPRVLEEAERACAGPGPPTAGSLSRRGSSRER